MSTKKCVVIACVSFETAMIVEPAVGYGADEIHLFHYIRDPETDTGRIYTEFYREVCNQISEKLPKVRIVEHDSDPIYDFQMMFRDILGVISEIRSRPEGDENSDGAGPDADILINSSAGTSEFSAAAIVASMMSPGVSAFTVGTREFTIKTEDIRSLYYRAGRPVGLTEHTNTPRIIPNFDIEMPPENQVLALREFHRCAQEGTALTARSIIQHLKEKDLWTYKPSLNEMKTAPKQKETMYYQRHYLEYWISHGWIEKPNGNSKYRLTENGLVVIGTFYV